MIIRQLTDNNYTDYDPRISGKNITWTGFGEPNPSQFEVNAEAEIFFYNGSEIRRLTDNNFADRRPDISGNNIAWQSGLEPFKPYNVSPNISFFDGNQIIDITGDFGFINNNFAPQISGDNVIWEKTRSCGRGGCSASVTAFFDGNETIELTNVINSRISGNNIVWSPDDEIFLYNDNEIIQVTDNDFADYDPDISDENITWTGFDDPNITGFGDRSEAEIFFYNGSEITQLTNNNFDDRNPKISGTNIVWQSIIDTQVGATPFVDERAEIFFYNGSQIIQVTSDNTADFNYQISDNNIVWQKGEGNSSEIFVFNGSQIIQVTDNNFADEEPQISGDNIVWTARGEIFTANIADVDNESVIPIPIQLPSQLLKENEDYLYRFNNQGAYLFTNRDEGNQILGNSTLNDIFYLEGRNIDPLIDTPAIKISTQSGDDLISIYRLRSKDDLGNYLFVDEAEYNQIFASDSIEKNNWVPEGLNEDGIDIADFYVYGAGSNQGETFNRFRNVNNNGYLFVGIEESNAILNDTYLSSIFVNEGEAFEGLV